MTQARPIYTILLPPSESKAEGGDDKHNWRDLATSDRKPRAAQYGSFCMLNEQRRYLIETLHAAISDLSQDELRKLFGVKGDNLTAAIQANREVLTGPLLPAIRRYTGVMFDYLDYDSMDDSLQSVFEERTVFFSGLWGLLRPTDLIPDYKLKINASLPDLGRVHTYWKPYLSPALNETVSGSVVWDLLPNAHRRAWNGQANMAARWQVKFVQRREKDGDVTYRTVSHWSKALKGALIRYICANDITEPEELSGFEHPKGYVYSREQSDLDEHSGVVVFVKE